MFYDLVLVVSVHFFEILTQLILTVLTLLEKFRQLNIAQSLVLIPAV